jgi:hypothetical protein
MPAKDVMATFNVPQRTAYRWLEKYGKEHQVIKEKA